MKAKNIRSMGVVEIEQKVFSLRQELAKERAASKSGTKAEKPAKIRNIRRDIARLLTVLNEKQLGAE